RGEGIAVQAVYLAAARTPGENTSVVRGVALSPDHRPGGERERCHPAASCGESSGLNIGY
ncbi:MAG TPA: hypothetical protein PLX02_15660, partial [Syntrophorhabdaceae bacterium]|nr:hypothetical protein [Syntrophorhabdaceae bacterium]